MKELGIYRELTDNDSDPSIQDFISPVPHPYKRDILAYLRNERFVIAVSSNTKKDIITNESMPIELIAYSDGEYSWYSDLVYYFNKYNLLLPEEFLHQIEF